MERVYIVREKKAYGKYFSSYERETEDIVEIFRKKKKAIDFAKEYFNEHKPDSTNRIYERDNGSEYFLLVEKEDDDRWENYWVFVNGYIVSD